MSRVFVTGAGGFIGSALVRTLERKGHEVHAMVRSERAFPTGIAVHIVDLMDAGALRTVLDEVRPGVIFHLAIQGVTPALRNEWQICQTNIQGTVNLLEATEALAYTRLVALGGGSEYGAKDGPIREDVLPEPKTIYGASKAAATTLCLYAARALGKPITVLRPFSVYGPGERDSRLIPSAIRHILRNEPIPLTAGETRRDFVYVDDVVEACLLAMDAPGAVGRIFNIGTGVEYSNAEVIETIQGLCGTRTAVLAGAFPARASDTPHLVPDISAAREVLGWSAAHDLPAGLGKTIAWYRQWT